jgi:uncharacterized membrane protein
MQVRFYLFGGRHAMANPGLPQQVPFLSSILTTYQSLRNVVIGTLLVSATGLLLGHYTSFFVDVWGWRPIQILGFAMLALLLAVLGELTTNQECLERVY